MDQTELMHEVMRILETHDLACKCDICSAYVNAATPRQGLVQAAEKLSHQRGAGLFERPN